jgi:LuxR family maltose regulon positive regulatory protein
MAQGTPASLREAARIVDEREQAADGAHNPLRQVRAAALRALLLQAEADTDAALVVLERTLARTRAGGLIRTFVDFGPPMQRLLVELAGRSTPADPYLGRLLAAFPSADAPPDTPPLERAARPGPVEELTWREQEVLELLGERFSNKEIAERLVVSPLTVKGHTIKIYQKLGVNGRRAAVAQARILGLLRPER